MSSIMQYMSAPAGHVSAHRQILLLLDINVWQIVIHRLVLCVTATNRVTTDRDAFYAGTLQQDTGSLHTCSQPGHLDVVAWVRHAC